MGLTMAYGKTKTAEREICEQGTNVMTCGDQPMDICFYSSHTSLAPIHRHGGMEGFVGMGGKPGPETWNRMHATADASSECATTCPKI